MARTKENLKERQKTDSIFAVYDQDGKLIHDGTADRTNKISHKEAKKNLKSRLRKAVAMEVLNYVGKANEGQKKMIFGKPFTYSGGKWVSDKGGAGGKEKEIPKHTIAHETMQALDFLKIPRERYSELKEKAGGQRELHEMLGNAMAGEKLDILRDDYKKPKSGAGGKKVHRPDQFANTSERDSPQGW